MTVKDVWKAVVARGPSSVLMNRSGAQTTAEATLRAGQNWDIIYFRQDGWSLACSFYLSQYAENLHRAEWIGYIRRGDLEPTAKKFT